MSLYSHLKYQEFLRFYNQIKRKNLEKEKNWIRIKNVTKRSSQNGAYIKREKIFEITKRINRKNKTGWNKFR